jgi:serine/threonine protein kinase
MTMVGGREQLDPLGEGGQGTVYRARSPKRVNDRALALTAMIENLPYGAISIDDKRVAGHRFATTLLEYSRPEALTELGALKIFKSDLDKAKAAEALGRFKNEITILRENRPGLLKLLDSSENEGWMVTELMPDGTIEDHPDTFKGDALSALKAFQSLVKTVASLHQDPTVHRDIKPANIFIGDSRSLVLGDFVRSFTYPIRRNTQR